MVNLTITRLNPDCYGTTTETVILDGYFYDFNTYNKNARNWSLRHPGDLGGGDFC